MSKQEWSGAGVIIAVLAALGILFWQSERAVACHNRGGTYAKTLWGGYKCLREEKL